MGNSPADVTVSEVDVMIVSTRRAAFGAGILVLAMGGADAAVAKAPASTGTGPSTTVAPYVLRAARSARR